MIQTWSELNGSTFLFITNPANPTVKRWLESYSFITTTRRKPQAISKMPPRRAAMMQGYRSPSPPPPSPPALDYFLAAEQPQLAKSKVTGKKRKLAHGRMVVSWRKWIKVFKDGGNHPSKFTYTDILLGGIDLIAI